MSQTIYASVIYGVDQIQDGYRRAHYPIYVQMGNFSTMNTAKKLQHHIRERTHMSTVIQPAHGRYKVITGPFRNQSSLKAFASKIKNSNHKKQLKQQPNIDLLQMPHSSIASIPTIQPESNEGLVLSVQRAIAAYTLQRGSHPEFSVFLGGSYIPNTIKGQKLQLLPYEIGPYADTFTNQSSAGAFTWGIDAIYRFKLHAPSIQYHFFDSLGTGIDFFQITNFSQTGNVLEFNLPEFENYTYTLKLNNIRVMANFDLDFHPIRQYFIPFIQAGIGGARTEVSYNSAPISPVDSPNLTLPNQASWDFSYQVGAGIKYITKTHVLFSLRYLYANMGKVNSSTLGSTTILATPLTVNMSTQNFLFGLTYLMA